MSLSSHRIYEWLLTVVWIISFFLTIWGIKKLYLKKKKEIWHNSFKKNPNKTTFCFEKHVEISQELYIYNSWFDTVMVWKVIFNRN